MSSTHTFDGTLWTCQELDGLQGLTSGAILARKTPRQTKVFGTEVQIRSPRQVFKLILLELLCAV